MKQQAFTLDDMFPLNVEEEKKKFLFDQNYNPQFVYKHTIPSLVLARHGEVSDHYLDLAESILHKVIKKWGSEEQFLADVEGELSSREALNKIVTEYLTENKIDQLLKVVYSKRFMSPASFLDNTLRFRLPVAERTYRILPTLHHEIGTHFFRTLNDKQQPWHHNRKKYGLREYLETEEGIASIHSHMSVERSKLLWFPALYYYLVYQASKHSFVELNKVLKTYVDNRERRWNMCVRMKRGITDTSVPGAITKDQVYLRGIIKMLSWLTKHDYTVAPLYLGKIAVEDLEKASHIAGSFSVQLPKFLQQNTMGREQYKKNILLLIKENGLKSFL